MRNIDSRDFLVIEEDGQFKHYRNDIAIDKKRFKFGTKLIIWGISIFISTVLTVYTSLHKEAFDKIMTGYPRSLDNIIAPLFNSDTISLRTCAFLYLSIIISSIMLLYGIDAFLRTEESVRIFTWYFASFSAPVLIFFAYLYIFYVFFPNTPDSTALVCLFIFLMIGITNILSGALGLFKIFINRFCEKY